MSTHPVILVVVAPLSGEKDLPISIVYIQPMQSLCSLVPNSHKGHTVFPVLQWYNLIPRQCLIILNLDVVDMFISLTLIFFFWRVFPNSFLHCLDDLEGSPNFGLSSALWCLLYQSTVLTTNLMLIPRSSSSLKMALKSYLALWKPITAVLLGDYLAPPLPKPFPPSPLPDIIKL